MRRTTRITAYAVLLASCQAAASSEFKTTLALHASRDATLIEARDGNLGDGRGPGFRVGRTNQAADSVRRALIAFDEVPGRIPAGSRIVSATLILHMSGNNVDLEIVRLYRVVDAWGEGGSLGSGGGGVAAAPGDATWIHQFHNPAAPGASPSWSQPGGDFLPHVRAEAMVGGPGYYSWDSARLAEDVQLWFDVPAASQGWVLLGQEASSGSVKRFDSRESEDEALRPVLLVEFIPPDDFDPEPDDEGGDCDE